MRIYKPFFWLAAFMLIVGLACGFSFGTVATEAPPAVQETVAPQPQETEVGEPVEPTQEPVELTQEPIEPTQEPVEPTGGAINSLDQVQNAVVQIEAQGTYVNPDFSVSYNTAGFGSGFIIDPSGIAITNNHVVTGSPLLKVKVGGDQSETYNAKVLGVSECSDLAVIDIEGDGFPYLAWHEGPINVGLEVYAAGFPLGEPQFTLTKGIVSKQKAGGETSWASVDYVIEHDSTINPGNSGGPLVDENGNVVGVNYRGRETNQYYAIGRDLAVDVIEQLQAGEDIDAIGVNGEAFAGDDFSGIWVYSVESGSPADKAGVKGGDIITTMENLVLATDGTMADYCDILRSHTPGDTLGLEVLRYATGEVLTGQLNGRELEASAFFGNQSDTGETDVADTGAYSGYTTWTDASEAIQLDLPNEWTEVDGSNWEIDGDIIGSTITGAADLENWENTWNESGVFFGASDDLAKLGGYVNLLDVTRDNFSQSCKLEGRYDYSDALYRGKYDLYSNCDGSGNAFITLSAVPNDNSQAFLILVEMNITKEVDYDALDQILATFQVIGTLP